MRPAIINAPQRAGILQIAGTEFVHGDLLARKAAVDGALVWAVAKYGSQYPWRSLIEDVPEPAVLGGDAAGAWAANEQELEYSMRRMRQVRRCRLATHYRADVHKGY